MKQHLQSIAAVLQLLGDGRRLRILRVLMRGELCVCELVDALKIPQYKVSRHLRSLRSVGLVESRRNGRWMYYRIGRRAQLSAFHQDLLKVIDVHLDGRPEVGKDDARLSRRLAMRQEGRCVVGKTCC